MKVLVGWTILSVMTAFLWHLRFAAAERMRLKTQKPAVVEEQPLFDFFAYIPAHHQIGQGSFRAS
jgi:hypothetical protein